MGQVPFQAATILSSRWGAGLRSLAVRIIDKAGFKTPSWRRSTDMPNLAAVSSSPPRTIRTFWPLSSSCGSLGRKKRTMEKYENGHVELAIWTLSTGCKHLYFDPSNRFLDSGKGEHTIPIESRTKKKEWEAEKSRVITCQMTAQKVSEHSELDHER